MKIALAIKNFSLGSGGGERYAVELAGGLVDRGHQVLVFAAEFGCSLDGVENIRVPMLSFPTMLRQWSFNFFFQRIIKKYDVDCVYALTECYPVDAVRLGGGINRFWLRCKHDSKILNFLERLRLRNWLKTSMEDRIFTAGSNYVIVLNSNLCRRQAQDYYALMPSRLEVIYNGKDIAPCGRRRDRTREFIRSNHGLEDEHIVYLFMANNFRRKGLTPLLGAFARLSLLKPEARLMVAGSSPGDLRFFVAEARRLHVADKVIFTGAVKDPVSYFCASDAFVLPTRYDPFANVCLEAMACGTGVITTSSNGAAEVLGNGGLIADTQDELYTAMMRFTEPAFREKTGHEAELRARDFTLDKTVFATIDLFRRICELKKQREIEIVENRDEKMLFAGTWKKLLSNYELTGYEELCSPGEGTLIKKNRKRQVRHFKVADGSFYVKEQFPVSWKESLKMLSHFEMPFAQSRREWNNLLLMQKLGIDSAQPVCCGWKKGVNSGSFLWMKDIGSARRLEDVFKSILPLTSRRAVIRRLARMAAVLHGAGYVHKDFYLGHVFLEESELDTNTEPHMWLLDVQRVARFSLLRKHWIIKDLSALLFSSMTLQLTRSDRLYFYRIYAGKKHFETSDKQLIRSIISKARRVASHTEKLLERRRQSAEASSGGKR